MSAIDWSLAKTDPIGQQARAFTYADQVAQSAAARQAGQQFSQGDYNGAAQTQAQAGNIDSALKIQDTGIQHFQTQQAYLQRAVPVFQQILQQHGPQAVLQAYDHIAPDLQTIGVPADRIAEYRNALATDPQGTLQSLAATAQHQFQYHAAGDTVFVTNEYGQLVGQYNGTRFVAVPQGGQLVQTSGDQPAGAMQPPAASEQSQPAAQAQPMGAVHAGGGQIIPAADPGAMHVVESGNNPNAVSSAGAVGVGQTLPSTLASPGFGVAPAKDNSPTEQQRVADQYLSALNQHYGNPVLAHIAYNYGPGNTDKWLQSGGDFSKLPPETQQYLGRIAVAQAVPQGGTQTRNGGPHVVADNRTPIDQEAIDNDVRLWIASKGSINPNYGMGAAGVALRQAFDSRRNQIMQQMGVTPEDVASGQAARKADMQSLTKLQANADQISAFEQTASKNADLALQLAAKGGGASGQSPLVNKWVQEYRKWINGDKNVSSFTAALGTFADEYAKVVGGQNGSTDSLRAEAYNRINTAMNQGQLQSVVQTMKQEMANRTSSNDYQLNTIKARLGDSKAQAAINGGGSNQPAPKVIDFSKLRK